VVFARQGLRWTGGTVTELAITLHACVVREGGGPPETLQAAQRTTVLRGVFSAVQRLEAAASPRLAEGLLEAERSFSLDLRRPTDDDRAHGIVYAVTPLLAAIVTA
jgi:hypothetical protein